MTPRTVTPTGEEVTDAPLLPVVTGRPDLEVRVAAPAAPAGPPRPPATGRDRPLFVPSSVMTIVSVMALTFLVTIGVAGSVRHARDQQTAYADFRAELANATAPVTQTDERGRLHPLGTAVAVLDIPQIGVREVVFEGTTSGVLRSGPGHRRDSAFPGQEGVCVLMGRQAAYGGPFKDIKHLRKGQVFTVWSGQGKAVYRVIGTRRAGDVAPPPVAAGKGRIILITAAGSTWVPQGTVRLDADLVSKVQPTGPRPLTTTALPGPERALQGDPSVWISVLLVSQLLFAASVAVTWARYRWGGWQAWLAGGPLLLAIGMSLSDLVARLLPNLM